MSAPEQRRKPNGAERVDRMLEEPLPVQRWGRRPQGPLGSLQGPAGRLPAIPLQQEC